MVVSHLEVDIYRSIVSCMKGQRREVRRDLLYPCLCLSTVYVHLSSGTVRSVYDSNSTALGSHFVATVGCLELWTPQDGRT